MPNALKVIADVIPISLYVIEPMSGYAYLPILSMTSKGKLLAYGFDLISYLYNSISKALSLNSIFVSIFSWV